MGASSSAVAVAMRHNERSRRDVGTSTDASEDPAGVETALMTVSNSVNAGSIPQAP
jgi:hypothetical protein